MKLNTVINGDCRTVLKTFPDGVIDCVVTSPPFWGLRDYGIEPTIWGGLPTRKECMWCKGTGIDVVSKDWNEHKECENCCEHSWGDNKKVKGHQHWRDCEWKTGGQPKEKESAEIQVLSQGNFCIRCTAWRGTLGLEPHPSMFITHLVDIFKEVKRVLKNTGSIFVNLGDSYFGGGRGADKKYGEGRDYCPPNFTGQTERSNWLQPKQLLGLPERFMVAMQEDGWVLRNNIIWYKRNPMPSSVKDRFNTTWEYMFFFVKKSKGYWFDLDAVRIPSSNETLNRESVEGRKVEYKHNDKMRWQVNSVYYNPAGRNPGDVFHLSTESFSGAHFATFPCKLIEKPILATVPEWICQECGQERVRIVERTVPIPGKDIKQYKGKEYYNEINVSPTGALRSSGTEYNKWKRENPDKTTGWTTCTCHDKLQTSITDFRKSRNMIGKPSFQFSEEDFKQYAELELKLLNLYKPGIVLDPFGGSGTVGVVAKRNNRNYIIIDAKPEYCEMARERILKDKREVEYEQEKLGQENLFK